MYEKRLIELALKAREKAYCPYSNFAVGAALLARTAPSTPAATSSPRPIPPPSAPSAPPSLKRCRRASGNLSASQ